ncbi:MAG: hypothetical protein SGARI_002301 [Bacillariaceae sp.]
MSIPTNEEEHAQAMVRERQWIYLGPILAAPLAHIAVTLYQSAKTPAQRRLFLGIGVVGSTVGYPGGPNYHAANRERVVSKAERKNIQNPNAQTILKEALKGFG